MERKLQNYKMFINSDSHLGYQNILHIAQIKELERKPNLRSFFHKLMIIAFYGKLTETIRTPINLIYPKKRIHKK